MMDQQTISDKLFYLTTKIITFDEDNFRRNILSEISSIFDFEVSTYLNVIDYEKVFLTEFKSKIPEIAEQDFLIFLEDELFSWPVEHDPFIGTFNTYSVVAVPFQQQTWGVFLASRHPLNKDIIALQTFAKSVSIWFDYPHMFHSTEPPVRIDVGSEKKYAALRSLYSISEWEWKISSDECIVSDAFFALFDFPTFQESSNLNDIYQLIGEANVDRFKECIQNVIKNKFQVLEEFKCPLKDNNTFQHIQMLFDPNLELDEIVSIQGYCRDNGRTYLSDEDTLKWYDSEWLHELNLVPLEWILHSNDDCELTFSPLHKRYIKEDAEQLFSELQKHLNNMSKKIKTEENMNITVKLPFSKYKYQLLASKYGQDQLLWRGFLILISEKEDPLSNSLALQAYESHNQKRVFQFIRELSMIDSISIHKRLIQYLLGLPRYSSQEYQFDDFWSQVKELIQTVQTSAELNCSVPENFRISHAQWVLSLLSFLIDFFNLRSSEFDINCSETSVIESQNSRILDANHVFEISITTTEAKPVNDFVVLLIQMSLVGVGIDVKFSSNDYQWKATIYVEAKAYEQPCVINSQQILSPSEDIQKKTILIVDDDQYNTQTLEVLLHSDGFRTITANQGVQALKIMESVDLIDVIILDLRMPVMDGFGVLEQLKKAPLNPQVPIVILSANITPDVSERLRNYQISAIIEKPFEMDDLIANINSLIKKHQVV